MKRKRDAHIERLGSGGNLSHTVKRRVQEARGITLVELIVALAIVAVLSAIVVASIQSALGFARMTREVSAGKNIITSYLLYAQDHGGELMPGMNRSVRSVQFGDRQVNFAEAPHRYPYRLAPYLDFQLNGSILVNGNEEQIVDCFGTWGGMYDYGVSLWPALGMNIFFIGGTIDSSGDRMLEQTGETVTNLMQIESPLVVFASGGGRATSEMNFEDDILGYYEVKAPCFWSSAPWSEDSWPSEYGNLAPRYDGRVVTAYTDGRVEVTHIEELRDMRLWSAKAARQGNANYKP